MSKLIITGATGTGTLHSPSTQKKYTHLTFKLYLLAGFAAYLAALADPSVSRITLLLRREIPSWANLPSNASEKSKTIIVKDFMQYPEDVISQIADHDGCVWALGKAVQGLSEEEYMNIHLQFPLAAVESLKKAGVGSTEKPFNFVYVSGEGSDPSQKSLFMWARGKVRAITYLIRLWAYDRYCVQGRAETELAGALDTPTTRLLVARPGYFFPAHAGQRQNQHGFVGRLIDATLMGPLFTNTRMGVSTETLGSFLVESAKGSFPNVGLANNAQLKQLLKNLRG
jgi:hypothetical protein